MRTKSLIAVLLLIVAGLQTASAQGFRVYKSDGTFTQFSFRTDSIVFYEGAGEDVDFGPFTPVNQCIVGTWYKSKSETVTFNNDGSTDYIEGATYEFLPYQGVVIFYNVSGAPVNILKVYKVTADKLIVCTTGDSKFKVWGTMPQSQPVEEIVLSETSLSLQPDGRATLIATVLPEDANNKTVTWESNNEDIAEVNRSGRVTANAEGSCIITCRATDGSGVYAECQVTVGGEIVVPEEHEWVDLGLPSGTLWATCNVGASSPEAYGNYYAWGETFTKINNTWNTYKYSSITGTTLTKYCTSPSYGTVDNKTELEPSNDAATENWGTSWQMPSLDQFKELINSSYTYTEWTTTPNGVKGRKITSKSNGKSIFLPAAGYRNDAGLSNDCSDGLYWSRSLYESDSRNGWCLDFGSSYINTNHDYRCYGRSVRPVRVQTR